VAGLTRMTGWMRMMVSLQWMQWYPGTCLPTCSGGGLAPGHLQKYKDQP